MPITCYKGKYIKANKFIVDETGEVLQVYPYGIIADKLRPLYPLECFINVDENKYVKDFVLIESQ